MLEIIYSISASTIIFILFRVFGRLNLDVFQAVVFNYFSAFLCGYIFFYSDFQGEWEIENWWYYSLILGALFISIFNLMGRSSNSNGIGLTSIATKISLLISIIFTILFYKEGFTILKILGIIFAAISIVLISFPKKGAKLKESGILIAIFLGSGLIEIVLSIANKSAIHSGISSVFTSVSFLSSGIIGLVVLGIMVATKSKKFCVKNMLAGIILGIPNFFSIYFLVEALKKSDISTSSVFGIINISIVILSFVIGILAFKEKPKLIHIIGVLAAILSLALFMYV